MLAVTSCLAFCQLRSLTLGLAALLANTHNFGYQNFERCSSFHKTFDKRFAKFVVNFLSSLGTWEFHYLSVTEMANFVMNLGISRQTLWD